MLDTLDRLDRWFFGSGPPEDLRSVLARIAATRPASVVDGGFLHPSLFPGGVHPFADNAWDGWVVHEVSTVAD